MGNGFAPQRTLSSGWQMTTFSLQLIVFIQSQIFTFEMLPNKDFKVLMQTRDFMMGLTVTRYPSEASRVSENGNSDSWL